MSESNIGILSTPSNNGSSIKVDEDNFIIAEGIWKSYIKNPSGIIYWNDQENSKQICMFALNDLDNIAESYTNNAGIVLNSYKHPVYPGEFYLIAMHPNKNRCELRGTPDKQLTWCDKPVVVVDSNSTISEGDGTLISWYRKYSDGWIEQGGYIYGTSSYGTISVTFPIAFKTHPAYIHGYFALVDSWFTDANITLTAPGITDTISIPVQGSISATGCKFQSYASRRWYACGY